MKEQIEYIAINIITPNPFQPRETFNKEKIEELAESIKKEGLLEPIIVRRKGKTFEIIAGERRWRACQYVKLKEIPVIIKNVDDLEAKELSLVENWHRTDLEPNERERFIYNLWKEGEKSKRYGSIRDMADKIGVPFTTINDFILANEDRKELTGAGQLTYTDFSAARPIKDDKKIWEGLLEKRAEGKIKRDDLRKTTQILKETPKVKEAVKSGYASIDEVIKLSSRNLEPAEVEEKIMKTELIVSEIDTGKQIVCPICNKKLRIIHKDPEGHKIDEIEDG